MRKICTWIKSLFGKKEVKIIIVEETPVPEVTPTITVTPPIEKIQKPKRTPKRISKIVEE